MKLLTSSSEEALTGIYKTWANALSDLSEESIAFGVRRARDFTGYFHIAAFRDLCRITPEMLGMKDPHAAYLEACHKPLPWERQPWSHGAVYHAARETGRVELQALPESQAFPLFKLNYEAMCARVLAGEVLDRPVQKAIPESVPEPLTLEQSKARCAVIRQLLE